MARSEPPYDRQVFLNCPFDDDYLPLLRAITFTITACGFQVRCALEAMDAGEIRMTKILRLIGACRLGLHDISRTTLDTANGLPRFNMPLELGLFLGTAHFGDARQKRKQALIFDTERYRYQKFISDIAGQDIKAHQNNPTVTIRVVRDWLNHHHSAGLLPGGRDLVKKFQRFMASQPSMLKAFKLHETEISFIDWLRLVRLWLDAEKP